MIVQGDLLRIPAMVGDMPASARIPAFLLMVLAGYIALRVYLGRYCRPDAGSSAGTGTMPGGVWHNRGRLRP